MGTSIGGSRFQTTRSRWENKTKRGDRSVWMIGRAFSPGRQVPEIALIGHRRHCAVEGFLVGQRNVIENYSHKNSILKIIFAMIYCYTCPILFLVIVINISLFLELYQMYMCIRRKAFILWSLLSVVLCIQRQSWTLCTREDYCILLPG